MSCQVELIIVSGCPYLGGFLAKVTVKAADSKVTSKSDISETVREARESAAARMIASFYK